MRDKFERCYAQRHMMGTDDDIASVKSLREGNSYSNAHIADCWYFFYLAYAVTT